MDCNVCLLLHQFSTTTSHKGPKQIFIITPRKNEGLLCEGLLFLANISPLSTWRHLWKCASTYFWLGCLGIPWWKMMCFSYWLGSALTRWPFNAGSFLTNCGMKTPPTFQFLTACLSLTTLVCSKPFTSFVLHSLCHGDLRSLSIFLPFI